MSISVTAQITVNDQTLMLSLPAHHVPLTEGLPQSAQIADMEHSASDSHVILHQSITFSLLVK